MGVYHFMGLGLSPGAVTSAISYLADRYQRWNQDDIDFFSTSGSSKAPLGSKRGDVEALVLFTTREVIEGRRDGTSDDYVDNRAGQKTGTLKRGEAMPKVLKRFLPGELKRVVGGRHEVPIYWCEIDRTEPYLTFERIARVMHAAMPPGETGKEVWINLTGGNNVINLTLQLAASLLSHVPRIYYLLSDDIRCLRHTTPASILGDKKQDRFWLDIPIIYLQLDRATRGVLEVLEEASDPLEDEELLQRLKNHPTYWSEFIDVEISDLRRTYLNRMAGRFVRQIDQHSITVGQQWDLLKRYYSIVTNLGRPGSDAETNLHALVQSQAWFREDTLVLN